jgi:outer membrane receptor for ferrienterochelin and colicin
MDLSLVICALCLGASNYAIADSNGSTTPTSPTTSGDELTEIVVSGYRESLATAVADKRNAVAIVDTIASEDIGKFPEQNLAESLQRITGVQIQRSAGEGQYVSIRGLG